MFGFFSVNTACQASRAHFLHSGLIFCSLVCSVVNGADRALLHLGFCQCRTWLSCCVLLRVVVSHVGVWGHRKLTFNFFAQRGAACGL